MFWIGLWHKFIKRLSFLARCFLELVYRFSQVSKYTFLWAYGKIGWSSICVRFSQFEPEIMFDGMLNFKTHFMVWNCIWHEDCNGLFNIRNLVSSLILMCVRVCLCDTILYTWFGKKWKRLKKFWGWKISLVYAYFFKHLSLTIRYKLYGYKKSVCHFYELFW